MGKTRWMDKKETDLSDLMPKKERPSFAKRFAIGVLLGSALAAVLDIMGIGIFG